MRDWLLLFAPTLTMLLSLTLAGDSAASSSPDAGPRWSEQQLARLRVWSAAAPEEGLPAPDTAKLDAALRAGHARLINAEATELALRLARMHLLGAARPAERVDWHIADSDARRPLRAELVAALTDDRLDQFFAGLRPTHPTYAALRAALAEQADPAVRARIARNMERWRWLPRELGPQHLLANAAAFEVALWRDGREVARWPAISGKVQTPTPAVSAVATAVNFNPWWEVPESISSVSRMSRRLGYVRVGKRFRQKPGPYNSLGRMKVVMYNPWNIYLHDTPSRSLFGANERAFSHGCIRVSDALVFAQTLLGERKSPEDIDAIVASEKSVVVPLPRQTPVYVAYFTADVDQAGRVRYHKDIYGRDRAIVAVTGDGSVRLAVR